MKQSSTVSTVHDVGIPLICDHIRNENVMVKEMEFDYNEKNNTLITRAEVATSFSLSTPFIDSIEQQLNQLREEIIVPLINQVKFNFTLKIKVDTSGKFLFDDMAIIFKIDCKKRESLHDTFRVPFRVLIPFTEYIDFLSLRGRKYELAVIEAEVNVNRIDLLDILENPIVGPTAKAQWYNFAVEAINEAKKEYKLDVIIPVKEGEVTWQIPHRRRLQHIESFALVQSN